MPFPFLQTALGVCFFLLWLFIAAMMLSDRLAEVRRRRFANGVDLGSSGPPAPKMRSGRAAVARSRSRRVGLARRRVP